MDQRPAGQRFRHSPSGPRRFAGQRARWRHAVNRRMLAGPDPVRVGARKAGVLAGIRNEFPHFDTVFPLQVPFEHYRRGAGPDARRPQIRLGRKRLFLRPVIRRRRKMQRLVQGVSLERQDASFLVRTIVRHALERPAETFDAIKRRSARRNQEKPKTRPSAWGNPAKAIGAIARCGNRVGVPSGAWPETTSGMAS